MLGTMMLKGVGGDKKFAEGCALLEKAAAKGNEAAKAKLGKLDAAIANF